MASQFRKTGARVMLGSVLALGASTGVRAAEPATANAGTEPEHEQIIVTAVARGQSRLDAAISISALNGAQIQQAAPRSVAEIFRNIPGLRSESSGGEGNANIAVRGLPVASGGSKFLQIQEDGLPVLEYGDITFGTVDMFVRADLNLERVEALRGGSASTFASNSPGGVINMISQTGEVEGGQIQVQTGLDYGENRVDVSYGGHAGEQTRYHFGGFYRAGTGPRAAGYDGNRGGQIKANVTREFTGGYIRIIGKYLDDRAIAYLPNPVRVSGSDGDPSYANIANFSINQDTLHSRYITRNVTLDGNNNPVTDDLRDGMHGVVKSIGLESQVSLGGGWQLTERFRTSSISGRFISNFPSNVDSAASIATALGGADATLAYANGPRAGQAIANPGGLNGNGLLAQVVVFDTKLNSLANTTNDLRVSGGVDVAGKPLRLTGGLYYSRQTIDTDWLWTSLVTDVVGGGNAALVNVFRSDGTAVTQDGVYGYGASYFGCCRRSYNVTYTTKAPYASANLKLGAASLGASLRYDTVRAQGSIAGADLGGGRVGTTSYDINRDGTISDAETRVAVIPLNSPAPVDYSAHYLSYSFGLNYRLGQHASAFARYSLGGRANADRLLFGSAVSAVDGRLVNASAAVDKVRQAEAGVKISARHAALYATGFWASTQEQNYEATTNTYLNRRYRADGIELEGEYRIGRLALNGGGTWTHSRIVSDSITPANVGHTPRRQAPFTYQGQARYDAGRVTLGGSFYGTAASYTQDSNQLKLPAYTSVNAFAQVRPIERLTLTLNANNLFNTIGLTEAEDAAIPANGIVRARSINGRTISLAANFRL